MRGTKTWEGATTMNGENNFVVGKIEFDSEGYLQSAKTSSRVAMTEGPLTP